MTAKTVVVVAGLLLLTATGTTHGSLIGDKITGTRKRGSSLPAPPTAWSSLAGAGVTAAFWQQLR